MTHRGVVIKMDYEYIEKKDNINKEEYLNDMLKDNNNNIKDKTSLNNNIKK